MVELNHKSKDPIYIQISENIKKLIFKGFLHEGEKLPSVQQLSKTLSINPNTVQKAYHELNKQNYIYTIKGKGNFINTNRDTEKLAYIKGKLIMLFKEAHYMGLTKKELIDPFFEEEINAK